MKGQIARADLLRTVRGCTLAVLLLAGCTSVRPKYSHPQPEPTTLTAPEALEKERWHGLVNRFESLNHSLSDGAGFSRRTNESGALAWAESPLLEAYLDMYLATGHRGWLDRFVAHADRVVANTDRHRGVMDWEGRSAVAWSATRYGRGDRRVYSVHSALIVTPLLRFVDVVESDPMLADDYAVTADRYLTTSRQALSLFEGEYHYDSATGEGFIAPTRRGQEGESSRTVHAPLNIDAAIGRAYLLMTEVAQDSSYRHRAKALARHVRASLMARGGRYVWSYYCWRRRGKDPRMEDISHASLTVAFAVEAFREGIVFDSVDMVALGRTLEAMSHGGGDFAYFVTGESRKEERNDTVDDERRLFRTGDAVARWLMLLPHSPFIQEPAISYLEQRLSGTNRVHPLALLGVAKLLRYSVPDGETGSAMASPFGFNIAAWGRNPAPATAVGT